MKTIAFSGNRNIARAFFVLAALGGLYYLRRSGKSISEVLAVGSGGLEAARGLINRVAPPVSAATQSVASSAQI